MLDRGLGFLSYFFFVFPFDIFKIRISIDFMSKEERNRFLLGWPPFTEFKREMQGLLVDTLEEHNRPIKQDIRTLKESMISLTEGQKNIQKQLNNHVTDTDKKVNQINTKLDKLLKR